jgi:branched-chain amino acid transport system substrate-binding protein
MTTTGRVGDRPIGQTGMTTTGNGRRAVSRRAVAAGLALGPALLAARQVGAAEPPKDPPVFKFGALLGLTDKGNWNAIVMQRGINMAVDEINAQGGIDGIKMQAVIEDHQGVPRVGVDAMQRLRARDDIQAVLSSYSTIGLAVAPICEEHKIFMLDGGSVTDSLVGRYKYVFHNRSVATVLARAALTVPEGLGLKKMAEMAWATDDGQSLVRAGEADWKAYGGEVVGYETTVSTASNIDTQMAKLRDCGADFLAIWMFSPGPGWALKRGREFGMKQPMVGVEFTAEIAKFAGQYAEGYIFASDYFNPTVNDAWPQRFTAAYRKLYNADPEVYAANYYEGVYIIADAIRLARAEGGDYFTGERLAAALRAHPSVPSVYGGNLVFQPDGTSLKRIGIFKVVDGKAVFQHFAELTK